MPDRGRLVIVEGVAVSAVELAMAIDLYVRHQLDRGRGKWKQTGQRVVVQSAMWSRLQRNLVAGDEFGGNSLAPGDFRPLTEWASTYEVAPTTARTWAQKGKLPGAKKLGTAWTVPAGVVPPRRGTTR